MNKFFQFVSDLTLLEKCMAACVMAVVSLIVFAVIEEASFDYTTCQETDEYEDRHTVSWVQYINTGKATTVIIHPARNWTERKYYCPDNEIRWREEVRPQ